MLSLDEELLTYDTLHSKWFVRVATIYTCKTFMVVKGAMDWHLKFLFDAKTAQLLVLFLQAKTTTPKTSRLTEDQ